MDWIVPAQLVTLAGSLILVFTYLSLYLQERQRYLAVWLASWLLYTVRSIFEILIVLWGTHSMLAAMNLMSMVWSAALLFWGTRLFSGKELNRGWLTLFAGGSLLILAGIAFHSSSLGMMILTYSLAAFASISTGITLLQFRQSKGPARATTGWAFILWGLHKADHPFLRPIPWVAPYGYLLGTIFGFVSAIGMILVFLEKTKRELKASETKYRSIFENTAEGIFQATPGGRFLSVNPAYAGIFGYESADKLMADVKDIGSQTYVHPEDYQQFVRLLKDKGFVEGYERQRVRKDGTRIWVSSSARLVRNAAGEVLYCEGTVEDITARREAEEKLELTLGNLRKAVGGTIQAIVQVVEMRDPYTAGHQRRVADLARSIATEMGLPPDVIEGIRMAAVIHDIGKVSVPSEILSRPGKLTQNEFELVKDHPLTGCDILKDVEFPWPVAEIIYQHHERLDGSGYPRGLKGDEVLLEARIIALADVVEAMASHRPFRPAQGVDAALDEVDKNRGILYDPEVVDACVKLFKEKGYTLVGRGDLPTSQPSWPASRSGTFLPRRDRLSPRDSRPDHKS